MADTSPAAIAAERDALLAAIPAIVEIARDLLETDQAMGEAMDMVDGPDDQRMRPWDQQPTEIQAHWIAKAAAETVAERDALTAELDALRAAQDALVAASYEAAAQWHIARIAEMNAQITENEGYLVSKGLPMDSEANRYCRDSILNSLISVVAIRALTPADAAAALADYGRAERNKARREAAGRMRLGCLHTIDDRVQAICAMIEKE
ncbi:hypothetical protein [Gemmobacter denitrificans]|uniref:Uncharacterized protein n=1 Tax=Gemmobacter denitrificans TaxID=3123040 RepID=A0ABU8BSF8_9RHOB